MTPTSATGRRQAAKAGFTLVETLVVVVIIGLAASLVLMSAPDPRANLTREAETFAAHLVRAREEAVLSNRIVEVRVDAGGYAFDIVRGGQREPLQERPFQRGEWADETVVDQGGEFARIAFNPTGLTTPALVSLSRNGRRVNIELDGAGNVAIATPGA